MADTPFYVDPTSGQGYGTTANDYEYLKNAGIINQTIDWNSLNNMNAAPVSNAPAPNNSLINAAMEQQINAPSVNDIGKEAIAGAEKSKTLTDSGDKTGDKEGFWGSVGDSLSKTMKKNGGEIFANTLSGSAQGVLLYLIQRRKERADIDLENRRNQNRVNETNAQIARASAIPIFGSVVKSPSQGTVTTTPGIRG